ncbi:MAG: type II toxin-antitoxin system CcdA family antitoxin [Gammaproteobacteria bacterium]|nr:type II toxin-antitoxin system CcdA family antitoxin [Gammaproteobacteria bacterium]MCP5137807.1 type II toxin-antitoxin system CcdA family antitoxin [Gammaproteobacteria bacterium]
MRIEAAGEEKSPVNLRIRTSLKNKAKSLGVNLSQTLERSLEDEIRRVEQREWVETNCQAIEAYNRRIDERGPALAAYRSF